MEQLQKFLDLLGSYPTWVKIAILGLIVAILMLLLFGHSKPSPSPWKLRVFHFRNLTDKMKEDHFGERFPNLILDRLLRFALIDGGSKKVFEVSLMRDSDTAAFWDHEVYRQAPVVVITGAVEDGDDQQHFTVFVTVAGFDRTQPPQKILIDERLSVPTQNAGMRKAANDIAELIQRTVEQLPRQEKDKSD